MFGESNFKIIKIFLATVFSLVLFLLYKQSLFKFEKISGVSISSKEIYVGAWVGGFWNSSKKDIEPKVLKEFEFELDKKMAIANFYRGWSELADPKLIDSLNTSYSNGWTPMISSNPYFFDSCIHRGNTNIYKTIASGYCDDFITKVAKNLKAYNRPILLRFAWEMNIVDMDWGIQKVGATAEDFSSAWKHFHNIMREAQADNVLWVLAFNTHKQDSIRYEDIYPGDEYVDWVALDGFNWGKTQSWSTWQSFNSVFQNSYLDLTKIAPNKDVMISEFNSSSVGGDKSAWFKDTLTVQLPNNFPKIKAIIFFDEDKTAVEKVNWKINSSTQTVQEIKNAMKMNIYKSIFH